MRARLGSPSFSLERINLPPFTYAMEAQKFTERLPAARRYIVEHRLNEHIPGAESQLGIVMQGGLWNTTVRALHLLGLADLHGRTPVPLMVLNVLHPLVPEELRGKLAPGANAQLKEMRKFRTAVTVSSGCGSSRVK